MAITPQEFTEYLTERYPLYYAEPWDPVGWCMGQSRRQLRTLMSCVTVTPAVVTEARENQVDLLLTHHPFPFAAPPYQPAVQQLYDDLQAARIAVFSLHTAFDNAPGGINDQLIWLAAGRGGELPADRQQYQGLPTQHLRTDKVIYGAKIHHQARAAQRDQVDSVAGAGPIMVGSARLAELPVPLTLSAAGQHLVQGLPSASTGGGSQFGTVVRVVPAPPSSTETEITRVVAACGVASDFVDECLARQVDLLICGELRYHECLKLQQGGCQVILLSHHASEKFAMDDLSSWLAAAFAAKLKVLIAMTDGCPVAALAVPAVDRVMRML